MSLADFGFDLNTREQVTLIYLGVFLAGIILWRKEHALTLNVVRTFFAYRLTIVWILMSIYVVMSVWLLAWLNLWGRSNLKTTLLWWLTVGFSCVFKAQMIQDKPHMLKQLTREALTLSAVLLFIAELVSFPLWVELIMLPSILFFTLLIAHCERQANNSSETVKVLFFLRCIQAIASFVILAVSYWFVAFNIKEFWSLHTLREFAMPLMLWLMFIPFVYSLVVYMTYETAFTYLKVRPEKEPIANYARRMALLTFGCNLNAVERFTQHIKLFDISDKEGIKSAIQEVKTIRKKNKNHPLVEPSEGWSPSNAQKFLAEYDLKTEDYHRTPCSWVANSPFKEIQNNGLADRLSYRCSGNENAVTELRLELNGSNTNDKLQSQLVFEQCIITLFEKALRLNQSAGINLYQKVLESGVVVIGDTHISVEKAEWGNEKVGGYWHSLTIRHSMHRML